LLNKYFFIFLLLLSLLLSLIHGVNAETQIIKLDEGVNLIYVYIDSQLTLNDFKTNCPDSTYLTLLTIQDNTITVDTLEPGKAYIVAGIQPGGCQITVDGDVIDKSGNIPLSEGVNLVGVHPDDSQLTLNDFKTNCPDSTYLTLLTIQDNTAITVDTLEPGKAYIVAGIQPGGCQITMTISNCQVSKSNLQFSCDVSNEPCTGDMIVAIIDSSDHIAKALKLEDQSIGEISLQNNRLTGTAVLEDETQPLDKGYCVLAVVCDEDSNKIDDDYFSLDGEDCIIN